VNVCSPAFSQTVNVAYIHVHGVHQAVFADDDDPFIVLTETKFSICYIPVWARYSPLRTRINIHVHGVHQAVFAVTLCVTASI
jgi:hypothetical protein